MTTSDRGVRLRQMLNKVPERNAGQLARTIDALVAAARYEAGGERGYGRRPDHGRGRGAERIVQPVLENACRYGSAHVRVRIARENSSVVYAVEDDGPGVAADEHERIFEPGVRGRAQRDAQGAGLGLALARRLARSIDGDVAADPSAAGGRFLVRLPSG